MSQPRPPRRRGASGGSTPHPHTAEHDSTDHDTGSSEEASHRQVRDTAAGEAGEWVILQTSVRPSVRELARSVCNGVTRATGERFTLRQFLTEAIELHAARLARRYNHAQPWPTDARPLPPGRSLGRSRASRGSAGRSG